MKELFLTEAQIKRLASGKEVQLSRKGHQVVIASKKALKENDARSQVIQRLEWRIEKLKKQNVLLPPHECNICKKRVWKLTIHKALAHEGRTSNLPHLKPRS
jgi:hypothetical protein